METADRQIAPRHWIFPVGNEKQRQQFVKNLEREKNPNDGEPQIHAGNCDNACHGNRQIQTGKNPPGRGVRSKLLA